MIKYLAISLLTSCLLIFGCSKQKQTPPPTNPNNPGDIKIELLNGSNQTDTVGQQLKDTIIVKVTKNGVAADNYVIEFQGSGCNEDLISNNLSTSNGGKCKYFWRLSGTVGPQTLKAFVLDGQKNKLDSVTINAAGLASTNGINLAACTPFTTITSLCKISTGRLFCSFLGQYSLRYSDDNGTSWYPVKSLGAMHNIYSVVSSTADEIFVYAFGEGIYYSNDAGATWTVMGGAAISRSELQEMVYTPSGKLIIANTLSKVYISTDKGKTFTEPVSGLVPAIYGSISEAKNGALYMVGQNLNQQLYKSTNGGVDWTDISPSDEHVSDFYIDKNDWQYKWRADNNGGLYISKDNGVSFTRLISITNEFFYRTSVQSDGNLYYYSPATSLTLNLSGLYKTTGINNNGKKIFSDHSPMGTPYIVAKNNTIVVAQDNAGMLLFSGY